MLKIKVRQLGYRFNFFNFVFVLNVYCGGNKFTLWISLFRKEILCRKKINNPYKILENLYITNFKNSKNIKENSFK